MKSTSGTTFSASMSGLAKSQALVAVGLAVKMEPLIVGEIAFDTVAVIIVRGDTCPCAYVSAGVAGERAGERAWVRGRVGAQGNTVEVVRWEVKVLAAGRTTASTRGEASGWLCFARRRKTCA